MAVYHYLSLFWRWLGLTGKLLSFIWKHLMKASKNCKVYIQFSSVQSLSHVWLFATPWTIAYKAPLSMGFSQQGYWSGLPFPSPRFHQFSSVQSSVVSASLQPHESQHARLPCPSPTPGVHSDSSPSSQWCHPAISSSVVPFSSCPQSLPASESFPMSQLFPWLYRLQQIGKFFKRWEYQTTSPASWETCMRVKKQ